MKTMKKYLLITLAASLFAACETKPAMSEAELDALAEEKLDSIAESMAAEEMAKEFDWIYSSSKDEMTDQEVFTARITSPDLVNLEFPYEGGTYLTLHIRKTGNESEAFIASSNGQITDDFQNPVIIVRFDEDPAVSYSVSQSSDADPTLRFIKNGNKFIERLKTAKKVKIQLEYYNNGEHVYNFDVKSLKWNH